MFSVVDIVQPSMDNYTLTFDESTSSVQLMCSLNINISSNMIVTWLHNNSMTIPRNHVTTTGNTTALLISDLRPSNAGVYQCVFNDTVDEFILRRKIALCKYVVIVVIMCS